MNMLRINDQTISLYLMKYYTELTKVSLIYVINKNQTLELPQYITEEDEAFLVFQNKNIGNDCNLWAFREDPEAKGD